jgi:hypothetical protein
MTMARVEISYANQDFDWLQDLAQRLTDADRAAGRTAPAVGYSAENIDIARPIVRARLYYDAIKALRNGQPLPVA